MKITHNITSANNELKAYALLRMCGISHILIGYYVDSICRYPSTSSPPQPDVGLLLLQYSEDLLTWILRAVEHRADYDMKSSDFLIRKIFADTAILHEHGFAHRDLKVRVIALSSQLVLVTPCSTKICYSGCLRHWTLCTNLAELCVIPIWWVVA